MTQSERMLSKYDLVCPTADELSHVPDDLTVAQFILDSSHPTRPVRSHEVPWLIDDKTGRKVGFEELRSRTFGFANTLSFKYGIRENDVIVIFSPNHVDYPVAIWGGHRLGAIISCPNPMLTVDELAYQLSTTMATLLVVYPLSLETAIAAARIAGIASDRILLFGEVRMTGFPCMNELIDLGLRENPVFRERLLSRGEAKTKIALLSFSSGTTGKPKAVAIPHFSLIANVIQMAVHNKLNQNCTTSDKQRFRPGDVAIGVLPFFHIYGLVVNLHFMIFGAISIVVIPRFNFVEMLESIRRYKITHLLLVPPQAVLLCKHQAAKKCDFRHVKFALLGAAPASDELVKQLKQVLPNATIGQGYGLTETTATVSMPALALDRDGVNSCGRILPGVVCRVLQEDGTYGGFGDKGELHVKSPSIALRYSNNEQATKETFVDGWVRTGDAVVIDKDGEVFIVDRLKEIMKVRGYQVAPAELEGCLLDHPDVSDACVVSVPDEYSGEVPLAFVVLSEKAAKRVRNDPKLTSKLKAGIMKHVADHKSPYKRLAGGVEFVDVIPKNPSGKLLRRLLRAKAQELTRAKAKAKAKL